MDRLAILVLFICLFTQGFTHLQKRNSDGFNNNHNHPEWGSVGEIFVNEYSSKTYSDHTHLVGKGPNPRNVTTHLHRGNATSSDRYTAMFAFFGQLIKREIVYADKPTCPVELIGMDMSHDPIFHENPTSDLFTKMFLYRCDYKRDTGIYKLNSRKQINGATSWIDGSFIYGNSDIWSDLLRLHDKKEKRGQLSLDDNDLPQKNKNGLPLENYPAPQTGMLTKPQQFWAVGDGSAHSNPGLLALSVLFMKYHNAVARDIAEKHPEAEYSDQEVFDEARSRVVAVLQSIIYYEWLPMLLNINETQLPEYTGHKFDTAPYIDSLYATVASEWIMTLLPPYISLKSEHGCNSEDHLRMCDWWYDSHRALNRTGETVKKVLLGLSSQPAEKEDAYIVKDLLDYNFGTLSFTRTDAAALQIMRGRDFGLSQPERLVYGQLNGEKDKDGKKWQRMKEQLNLKDEEIQNLTALYDSPDLVDMFVLSLLEKDGSYGPGNIVRTVTKQQLTKLRDADYFWFENTRNRLFDVDEILEIKNTKLHDVMKKVYDGANIPENVFQQGPERCNLSAIDVEELRACAPLKIYDYFSGNDVAFIISWVWIGLFPFAVVGLAYLYYRLRLNKKQRDNYEAKMNSLRATTLNMLQSIHANDTPQERSEFFSSEWVGGEDYRDVRVIFGRETYGLYIQTVKCVPLRSINLAAYEVISIFVHLKAPFAVHLEIPKVYDLVLIFQSESQLLGFYKAFSNYISSNEKMVLRESTTWKAIRRRAVTKTKRKERINIFFRKVFNHAFNLEGTESELGGAQDREVAEFEVSKEEFAESLGMKANSDFVTQMFNVADKHQRGFLRFREILELVVIMSKGSPDRKLELLFDMFDFSKSGMIKRKDVTVLVKSLVDIAGSRMAKTDLEQLVNEMYSHAGLDDKDELDFHEFKILLSNDDDFLAGVNIDWPGVGKPKKGKSSKPNRWLADDTTTMNSMLHSKKSLKERRNSSTFSLDDGSENSDYDGSSTLASRSPSRSRAPSPSRTSLSTPSNHVRFNSPASTLPRSGGKRQTEDRYKRQASLNLSRPSFHQHGGHLRRKVARFVHYIENRKRELAVLFLFFAVCWGLFFERFVTYAAFSEHAGFRQTLSLGVAFARGAAEVVSFTYSLLLLTMCYNMVRLLRETFLNLYIPFDKNIVFHKIVAWTALFFTGVHVVAYGFNYYYLASGPPLHACFFKTSHYSSDAFIEVGKTLYGSLSGITGVLMVLILAVIFIFASQTTRQYMHQAFWTTHKLFIALFVLMGIHGLMWLTQKPNFIYYFIGPSVLYIIDKTISITRRKMKLDMVKANLLPSNVTNILVKRPPSFEYKSGMWVRIACSELGSHEYHPFTLTSAPHEEHISVHIRGVGPWTKNIRNVIQKCQADNEPLPCIYVDGPFGSGQQDWYNFEVSVLVGAGIGVTPYASILKDFVNMMKTKNRFKIKARKVYFIWSTSDQRSFEWLIDILKEVEEVDEHNTVSTNIFITRFFDRFDLRTSMLYVFEEHAKRIGGRSLFTGLQAMTSFGRPDFDEIFHKISDEHIRVKNIGVFSCGPPGITKGVEKACIKASADTKSQFQHHYENF